MAYTPTLWAKGDKVTSAKLNKIEQGIVDKVDKETGKTLSTNDFTDAYKTKLEGIEANADKTTIDATLTSSGAAADAKATGDAIKGIETDLDGKVATIESNLDEKVENLKSLVGTPLKATTASDMTYTSKIYVYTGNESGYTNGDWYYHDGSAWVDGGTYNSVAVEVDKTLTVDGLPADAKVTGDEIGALKSGLREASTVDVKAPSLLLDDWVLGTLGNTGIILEYSSRITTEKYHRYDTVTTIIDKNTQKHMTLCLYNDDYSLNSRTVISTATATVPANTLFRVTVWIDSTDITDISTISENVLFLHESTMSVHNTALSALGKGKLLLPSDYNQGNLGTNGAYDATYTQEPRIVFYQYMKYDKPIVLNIDFQYTTIICLYTSSLALISRTSYMGKNKPQVVIPANTYFRVLVYKWDARGTDMTRYAEAIYISTIMSNIPDYIRIFESFAVIGDSLSCGYVGSSTGTIGSNVAREAGRNWPTYLGLDLGRTFTNLARGSSSAHDWRYGNSSLDVNISTADIDTYCYMVAVGVNDSRQSLTVGTSADIKTDRSNNADTFYGNYDYIIRQLMEYKSARFSQAKIFVFTMPPSETNAEEYNNAIRHVASLYADVTCVDLYSLFYEEWTSYPFTATWVMGHSRPFGYALMADMIRKGVNLAMAGNVNQFLFTPWAPV